MLQPFEFFKPEYVEKLLMMKRRYLVSQPYRRAQGKTTISGRTDILLTDYDDLGGANIHLNAIKHEQYAAVIDLENPRHRKRMKEMLSPGSHYRFFWAVVKSREELEARIDRRYRENMRRIIEKKTDWRLGSERQIIPRIDVSFGELFITLKNGGERIRIKFEEIERS